MEKKYLKGYDDGYKKASKEIKEKIKKLKEKNYIDWGTIEEVLTLLK